ncbi:B12-binding domain-containing radical SAM protein [Candidatus Zixiibacteriota bacterium]
MKRKVYYIQPSYRKMDGQLVKGWALFNSSLNLPILSAITPSNWGKSFCLEYFDDVDYNNDASVVCLTSMSYDILHALEICREFKKRDKTVIFGCYQDMFSFQLLKDSCDCIFYGMPDLHYMTTILEDAFARKLVPEYHCGIHLNFPFDYSVLRGRKLRHLPALASVGCINTCDYCCHPLIYNGRYRLRRIKNVIEDLHAIQKLTGTAAFKDGNIYNNRKHLILLCSTIIDEGIDLLWGAQCTIDIGDDPEVLSLLHQAGCRALFIGLESLNQKNLDSVRKPYTASKYRNCVKQIRNAGIHVVGYFILGLDDDTLKTFDEIYSFVHDTRIALPLINMLIPIPGTRVFDKLKAEGRLSIKDEKEFAEKNPLYSVPCSRCLFMPKRMSKVELEHGFLDLARKLTSFQEIAWRSIVSNPAEALQIFKMNLDLRKEHRKLESSRYFDS